MIGARPVWVFVVVALGAVAVLRIWMRWGPVAAAIVLPAALAVGAAAGLVVAATRSRSHQRGGRR